MKQLWLRPKAASVNGKPNKEAILSDSNPPSANETTGTLPLLIGVTGHRHIREQDVEAVRNEVRGIFQELRKQYPHTPLVLVSPLAEGADRLVAEIALENEIAARLIVPLPWPEDVCPDLLHRTGSREEFDRLLSRAEQVVPLPPVEGATADEIRASEECREQHYEQVGSYIARHSQILIALWDGVDDPQGGTARVIRWHKQGEPAPYAPRVGALDELENGPVYHIATPRTGSSKIDEVKRKVIYPESFNSDEVAGKHFDGMWRRFEQFNHDTLLISNRSPTAVEDSKKYVVPEEKRDLLPKPLPDLFDCYALADASAIWFQGKAKRTLRCLFLLVPMAVVCFEIYAHLLTGWWWLLGGYIGLLGVAGAIHWRARRREFQDKYLDYRAVAEALRVQLFWRLAGLTDSVADHYLRNLRSELDWIRQAVRACNLVSGGHRPPQISPQQSHELFELIKEHWVADQHRFFKKKSPINQRLHHRFERLASACFAIAVSLALVLLAVHLWTHYMSHALVVVVFLAAVAVALLHEYAEKCAFSVQAQRYDWMLSLFGTAQGRLQEAIDANKMSQAQTLIKELGKEALTENADWVIQHRQRPIGPPSPG